ncbi:hypothetical protein DFJ73DRAFT_819909 [Zopfochytrium polystomum]|nr:hypothetical protein DFJ73DRAFT_819909 [Zopfochytrium polystomum]
MHAAAPIPPNVPGGVFGLPAWNSGEPFFNTLEYWMSTFLSTLLTGLSFAFATYYLSTASVLSPLNRGIQFYIFTTFLSAAAVLLFNISKMFSVVGALHNASENLVLFLFITKGRLEPWIVPVGLISDFSLVFHFYRLLVETRAYQLSSNERLVIPENGYDDSSISSVPTQKQVLEGGVSAEDAKSWTRVIWPLVAAFIHVFGNTLPTLFPSSGPGFFAFLYSYGISFPLYAYFVYLNVAVDSAVASGRIESRRFNLVWPDYSVKDHIKIGLASLVITSTLFAILLIGLLL